MGWGFGLWLPRWAKRAIVRAWNGVTCRLLGHEIFGPYETRGFKFEKKCLACCKRFPDPE
jgi:hypothetical protein